MRLCHQSDGHITSIYKILQSGYLKSGKETGVTRMWGWDWDPSKYIYLTVCGIDRMYVTFELDSKLLLDNFSYLNIGWCATPSSNAVRVKGKNINEVKLSKILNKYVEEIKEKQSEHNRTMSHEILLKHQVDLKKYLRKVNVHGGYINNAPKTFDRLLKLIDKEYPNVKVAILKF